MGLTWGTKIGAVLLLSSLAMVWGDYSKADKLPDRQQNQYKFSQSLLPHTPGLWKEGMCKRISRQSANLVGKRGRREVQLDEHLREGRDYLKYPDVVDRGFAARNRGQERTVLQLVDEDQRPKCQPIGESLGCRCDYTSGLPAAGWCALWKCKPAGAVQKPFEVIGHWECATWC